MQAEDYINARAQLVIYHNLRRMLADRGYSVERCGSEQHLMEKLLQCVENNEPVFQTTNPQTRHRAVAFFPKNVKLSVGSFRAILEWVEASVQENPTPSCCVLVVTEGGLTPVANNEMFADHGCIHFESWKNAELAINITEHVIFSKHTALSPEAAQQVLTQYQTTPDKLYQLRRDDPAAKYYALKPGTIVKVDRRLGLLPPYTVYRHVK